jgi:hypothetical protein
MNKLDNLEFSYVDESYEECNECENCEEELAESGCNLCIYCLESDEEVLSLYNDGSLRF